jgi:hypothetical protein
MSSKFGRSVVFGHGHWWGIEHAPDGKKYHIAPGCMCDPQRIGYRSVWDTSHSEWVNGFLLILERNKPILFELNTSWGLYGIK